MTSLALTEIPNLESECKEELFFGVGNEFCWIGSETGEIIGKKLFEKECAFRQKFGCNISSLAVNGSTLYAGCDNGDVIIIKTNNFEVRS